ncbi:probable 28S ribosomal protein S25, mitochondrial [Eurytemora carolleeae]|uniref:probable 28S ribosomal protein S25, mitochondrial n=1 Tax=Eurytemora carolleeae TaxID=1294199 RepID=UPI000C794876|nr:probable 28S ribosomal protein S25, mitochondrial [Eurytemora carolleeae]|eukprot:XP_023336118.1 probable 28S ribosomal protein S25, mitochondrial [Eurytemora affinis]
MGFMKGIAPIRRTTKYLSNSPLTFKPRVKIMTVNFNDAQTEENHQGARDFVFWNLPQVQYKNPDVQILTFKNMTPSPFITCFLEDNTKVYFDVDSQSNKDILDRLVKTLGKSKEVLEEEAVASEAKSNPANFCRRLGFSRHCICEMPGQIPCSSLVPVPRHWRGKWYNQGHRWESDD